MLKPLIKIPHRQIVLFAIFLVLYEFLVYMGNDMILPAMITVVQSFNAPETLVATSLSIYLFGGASLQLFLGPLSDSYGRRSFMLLGAFLFCVFTIVIACSQSMTQFLVSRFFQGMGLCFISVVGYATIQELFEEMEAIRLIAIMTNAAILAPLLGPVLGAIVIQFTYWRSIFILIAFFSAIALWGLWRYMPEPIGQLKHDGQRIQAAPFALREILKRYQTLLRNPGFSFGLLALSLICIPCICWIALAPIILISEAKLTVLQYSLWQIPVFAATILGNWFLRHLTYRFTVRTIIYYGSVLLTLGALLSALLPGLYGNHYQLFMPGIILYFFSITIINAPLTRYCLFLTSAAKGSASALISLGVMGLSGIGIEIADKIYQQHINFHLGLYFTVSTALFILFVSLCLKHRPSATD